MSETKPSSPDLSTLATDYEIVGEVGGPRDERTFMANRKDAGAKRRDDQTGVLISVVTSPAGDEGNALSHLAADTKLLAGSVHRRLMPVIDGRWLGADAFAVVTQRTTDPTLSQKLATGERFTTTRVAAILREVNGLLEWAREHNIVHRTVRADRIFLEPKTDRVRVSFGVAPIQRLQQTDAPTEDARTIVRLAMAMLTGIEDPAAHSGQRLAELRPELPERLRDATADLLEDKHAHTAADVNAYLALIGMADPLYAGETEASRIRAEVLEEQRVEREKLAAERAEFERVMAEERATFAKLMADERAQYAQQKADELAAYEKLKSDEHTAFERLKTNERDRAAREKTELQRAVEAERAALVAKRAELERVVADQRKELERVAADDRRRIEALRVELKAAGELEIEKKRDAALDEVTDAESTLDSEELTAPLFAGPVLMPIEALTFDDDNALMRDEEIVDEPVPVVEMTPVGAAEAATVATIARPTRKKWIVPAVFAALVAALGVSAIALSARRTPTQPAAAPVVKPAVAQTPVVTPPVSIVPLPTPAAVIDSSAGAAARAVDSVKARLALAMPKPKPKRIVRDSTARRDTSSTGDTVPLFRDASQRKRDPAAKKDTLVRPDTNPR